VPEYGLSVIEFHMLIESDARAGLGDDGAWPSLPIV
jgi:hypothetical protein